MCFSAQASFTASAILALTSIVAFKQVKKKQQLLLAAIPALFALQQATEGMLWISIRHGNTDEMSKEVGLQSLQTLCTYIFLFFALVLWPIWVPFTLFILEKNNVRKRLLWVTCLVGITITLFMGFHLFYYRPSAIVTPNHHIAYDFNMAPIFYIPGTIAYLIATAVPFFISSLPYFWIGGILIPLAYVLSYIFYIEAIGSIWCFSAALFSILISIMLHFMNKERKKDDSWYWRRFR